MSSKTRSLLLAARLIPNETGKMMADAITVMGRLADSSNWNANQADMPASIELAKTQNDVIVLIKTRPKKTLDTKRNLKTDHQFVPRKKGSPLESSVIQGV